MKYSMRIQDSGAVFTGLRGSDRQSATFPMPCIAHGGRWLCAFRAAPSKGQNTGQRTLLLWSDDKGRSWSAPREPFAPPRLGGRPGLMRFACLTALEDGRLLAAINWVDHSNPAAPYFNEATEGLLDTRIFLSISEDVGLTWSPPRLMDTLPFDCPTPLTGPVLSLPGDELGCQFELNKPYDDPAPWRHASVMMFSSDGGHTWPRHAIIAQDPANRIYYWDQRPALLPDGRIMDVFWTFDRQAAAYLNIHARESSDGGRTWSDLWDTGVPGQPGPVFPLPDATIAMPYVDRTAAPMIKVRRSADGGHTWPAEGEIVIDKSAGPTQTTGKSTMQDAWSEMYAFSMGLPQATPLPGGGALLVYYAGASTDVTSIRWTVVR